VRFEADVHRQTDPVARFSERVQRDWRRAFVRALTEPATEQEDGQCEVPSTPVEQLAARAVSVAWPHIENLTRPIFETTTESHVRGDARSEPAMPSGSVSSVRPAAWLSAEEVAPVLHMTAHTLRRLARKGQCPVVVRRIGGRWCFSRSDLERLVGDDAMIAFRVVPCAHDRDHRCRSTAFGSSRSGGRVVRSLRSEQRCRR